MNKVLLICLVSVALSATLNLENARAQMLTRHNYYRSQHQVGNLARLTDIETIAQTYSEYLASINSMVHSSNTYNSEPLGENLYWGPLSSNIGTSAVDLWYEEIADYDFDNPGWKSGTGHFTQVVWKGSEKLGCGVGCGSNNYCYVTCNYYPAGNYLNSFATNVFPLAEGTTSDIVEEDTTVEDTTQSDNTSGSSSTNTELETFRNEVTAKHNYYRSNHQVGNLVRDTQLENIAQEHAEYMAQADSFSFPSSTYNGEYIGKNLFFSWGAPTGDSIADMFYEGVSSYDFSNPGYNSNAGSFTQLVWKNTQKIGCGYACSGYNCYGICTYYPAGNYLNSFASNVFPSTS